MYRVVFTLVLAFGAFAVAASAPVFTPVAEAGALPSADDLLARIDRNMTFETRTARIKMVVTNPERTREFEMMTYGRGADQAAIEYLAPSRDKGTRMLRQGQDMWMYMPSVERTRKISGHMLRQGMMGSDLSYEDMMSASAWKTAYTATVVASESIGGRPAYKVEMNARDSTVAYPKRVVWVDQTAMIPIKQELYALSGVLLKEWEMSDIRSFPNGRQFPGKMVIRDKLQTGTSTTLTFSEVSFGVSLEEEVFSTRWLERK